jgi:hypothetical protein
MLSLAFRMSLYGAKRWSSPHPSPECGAALLIEARFPAPGWLWRRRRRRHGYTENLEARFCRTHRSRRRALRSGRSALSSCAIWRSAPAYHRSRLRRSREARTSIFAAPLGPSGKRCSNSRGGDWAATSLRRCLHATRGAVASCQVAARAAWRRHRPECETTYRKPRHNSGDSRHGAASRSWRRHVWKRNGPMG